MNTSQQNLGLFAFTTYFAHTNPDAAIKKRQGSVLALIAKSAFNSTEYENRGIRVLEINSRPDNYLSSSFRKAYTSLCDNDENVPAVASYTHVIPSMFDDDGNPLSLEAFSELVFAANPPRETLIAEEITATSVKSVLDGEEVQEDVEKVSRIDLGDLETAPADSPDSATSDSQEEDDETATLTATLYCELLQRPFSSLDRIALGVANGGEPYDLIIISDNGLACASNEELLAVLATISGILSVNGKLLWVGPLPMSLENEDLAMWHGLRGHHNPNDYVIMSPYLGGDNDCEADALCSNLVMYTSSDTQTVVVSGQTSINYDYQSCAYNITYSGIEHLLVEGDSVTETINQVPAFTVKHYIPTPQIVSSLSQTLNLDVLTFNGRYVIPLAGRVSKKTVLRYIPNPQSSAEAKDIRKSPHSYVLEFSHPQAPILKLPRQEVAGAPQNEVRPSLALDLNPGNDDEDVGAVGDVEEESE